MTYEFGLPLDEPLLWMADAVASAIAAGMFSTNDSSVEPVAAALEHITL